MSERFFESAKHTVGLSNIHVDIVLSLLSTPLDHEQCLTMRDALIVVIAEKVHVAQVLMSILDQVRILLLKLSFNLSVELLFVFWAHFFVQFCFLKL